MPEFRTVTELAPGLTRTSITRGAADPSLVWTAEVAIPSASPDPDAPASRNARKLGSLDTVGARLKIDAGLVNGDGEALKAGTSTDVVNGGPVVMSNGAENITAQRDGVVHGGDSNGFYCGWVHNATPAPSPASMPGDALCWWSMARWSTLPRTRPANGPSAMPFWCFPAGGIERLALLVFRCSLNLISRFSCPGRFR